MKPGRIYLLYLHLLNHSGRGRGRARLGSRVRRGVAALGAAGGTGAEVVAAAHAAAGGAAADAAYAGGQAQGWRHARDQQHAPEREEQSLGERRDGALRDERAVEHRNAQLAVAGLGGEAAEGEMRLVSPPADDRAAEERGKAPRVRERRRGVQ